MVEQRQCVGSEVEVHLEGPPHVFEARGNVIGDGLGGRLKFGHTRFRLQEWSEERAACPIRARDARKDPRERALSCGMWLVGVEQGPHTKKYGK
jgi:hypothetical protein